jgi:hypothetical protein
MILAPIAPARFSSLETRRIRNKKTKAIKTYLLVTSKMTFLSSHPLISRSSLYSPQKSLKNKADADDIHSACFL